MSGRTGPLVRALATGLALLAATARPGEAEPPAAACNDEGLPPAQIRCFLEAAQAAGDAGVCEGAEAAAVRFNCISLYAERSGEAAACGRIAAGDRETQALRDSCVAGVAVAGREPELCERAELPEVRDSCYAMLVIRSGADAALCERVANPALKSACAEGPAAEE